MPDARCRTAVLALICVLIAATPGCRPANLIPGASSGTSPVQLVSALSQATTPEATAAAIQAVVSAGLSLGVSDAEGRQLNQRIGVDAPSLSPDDVAALAYLQQESPGVPLSHVIEYLSSVGVTLAGASDAVDVEHLLPRLQAYVDWAFAHRSDRRAVLGLTLGTSPGGGVPPAAAPQLHADSLVSPTAAMLLLADIVIGVGTSDRIAGTAPSAHVADAAPTDTAARIQGLITVIEPLLKTLASDSVVARAKQIVAGYALGNRFALRILYQDRPVPLPGTWVYDESRLAELPVARSIDIPRARLGQWLVGVVTMVPSGQILARLPVVYGMRLISSDTLGLARPLIEDADLIVGVPRNIGLIAGAQIDYEPPVQVDWAVPFLRGEVALGVPLPMLVAGATPFENPESRQALLVVSGRLRFPDIDALLDAHGFGLTLLGLSLDDVRVLFAELEQDASISPWVVGIVIPPNLGTLAVTPAKSEISSGAEVEFTATASGALPDEPAYEWQVVRLEAGGIRAQVATGGGEASGSSVVAAFAEPGEYEVTASLWDTRHNERVAVGSARVTAVGTPVASLGLQLEPVGRMAVAVDAPAGAVAWETGRALTFRLRLVDTLETAIPPSAVVEWDWGDGSEATVSRSFGDTPLVDRQKWYTVTHGFAQAGSYRVRAVVRESSSGADLGSAAITVVVDDLPLAAATTRVYLGISVPAQIFTQQAKDGKTISEAVVAKGIQFSVECASPADGPAAWTPAGELRIEGGRITLGDKSSVYTLTGALSRDAATLSWLELHETYTQPNVPGKGDSTERRIVLRLVNVPLVKDSNSSTAAFDANLSGQGAVRALAQLEYGLQYTSGGYAYQDEAIGLRAEAAAAWSIKISLQR